MNNMYTYRYAFINISFVKSRTVSSLQGSKKDDTPSSVCKCLGFI